MQASPSGSGAARDAAVAAWDEPGWLDDVTAWIGSRVELTGPPEPRWKHAKPWSVIARAPTAGGRLWFKEKCPALAFEPALTETLARHAPDCTPEVVAVEGARMLIRDAGRRLRALEDPASPAWLDVVGRYAQLQIELAPVATELPTADSRPETLASRFGERVGPLVEVLGDAIPLSLVHLSLNDNHVYIRDGRPVFLDWDESGIAHPFCGLFDTFQVFVHRLGARAGGPEVLRVRDTYLESWTAFAPAAELRRIFAAANALGGLCRAASWERKLVSMRSDIQKRYGHKVEKGLRSFEAAALAPDALGASPRLSSGDATRLPDDQLV